MINILYLHAGAEMYGADKVLLELVSRLDKEKYKVHVILPCEGILLEKLETNDISVEVLEYPILRRKYFNFKGIVKYLRDYIKYSKRLKTYVEKNNIKIVHNNTTAVLEGIYLKRKTDIKLIWHVHEIIVKPKVISEFINYCMKKYADKIVAVSKSVEKHILIDDKYKDKYSVIYNGVDNKIYYPYLEQEKHKLKENYKIKKENKVIGMIGRINSWKGQNDFLKATNIILKKHHDVEVVLAGSAFEGEEWREKELDEKINNLKYKERIHRLPYIKETTELYNIFDIFVLPSTNPDPLPTVVLEAMACGKPIVAYEHGGVCEMVEDGYNGFLVKVNNFSELSLKIEELLGDKFKLSEMGKNSISRQKSKFSLEKYIYNFNEIYREKEKS